MAFQGHQERQLEARYLSCCSLQMEVSLVDQTIGIASVPVWQHRATNIIVPALICVECKLADRPSHHDSHTILVLKWLKFLISVSYCLLLLSSTSCTNKESRPVSRQLLWEQRYHKTPRPLLFTPQGAPFAVTLLTNIPMVISNCIGLSATFLSIMLASQRQANNCI